MNARRAASLAACLLICLAAGGVGSLFPPGEWYAAAVKPPLTPPGWVLPVAWTTLYALMGVSLWRVWERRAATPGRLPFVLFGTQLVLNAAWTALFFGLKRPDLAFVEIIAMGIAILATLAVFLRRDRAAGLLLTPYLGWVCFATYLNGAFWRLNP